MLLKWIIIAGLAVLAWRLLNGLMKSASPKVTSGRPTTDPYETLGVTSKASFDEVKRAYQSQIAQYHPDKVANLGPDLQKLAQEKTQALNAAYATIKKSRP